jgi:hypothetical protein
MIHSNPFCGVQFVLAALSVIVICALSNRRLLPAQVVTGQLQLLAQNPNAPVGGPDAGRDLKGVRHLIPNPQRFLTANSR